MGKVWSRVVRPGMQKYNFENRAQRVLEKQKDKAVRAPLPDSTKIAQEHQEDHTDELLRKDDKLLERLRQVKIDSFGPAPGIKSERRLPEVRTPVVEEEFGYKEPDRVPIGRVTLKQATTFLMEHQTDPTYSASVIANQYKLDSVQVENVLKYFHPFDVHVPKHLLDKYPAVAKALEKHKLTSSTDMKALGDKIEPKATGDL